MNINRPVLIISLALSMSLIIFPTFSFSGQSDLVREKRLADEIVDSILDGDVVSVSVEGSDVLGIYTESALDSTLGAVLILHGRGFHPDWVDVANPLRVGLTEKGWNTLSLQMPVLEKDAKYFDYLAVFPDAVPRIQAGIAYLKETGAERIIIIAHSCSVHMTMSWFEQYSDAAIDGFVGIGMGATDYQQPMETPFPLAQFKVPVLDLYGEDDYPAVHRYAPDRLAAIRSAGHEQSKQQVVPGANHYFSGADDALNEVVGTWLESLVVETAVK